jgi:hypothetical protein
MEVKPPILDSDMRRMVRLPEETHLAELRGLML